MLPNMGITAGFLGCHRAEFKWFPQLTSSVCLSSFAVGTISRGNPVRDFSVVTEQKWVIFGSWVVEHCDGQTAAVGFDFRRLSQFAFLVVRSKIKFHFHEVKIWTHWMLSDITAFHLQIMVIHWNQRCPWEHAFVQLGFSGSTTKLLVQVGEREVWFGARTWAKVASSSYLSVLTTEIRVCWHEVKK